MTRLLERYFVDGLSVPEIAEADNMLCEEVEADLRQGGVSIPPGHAVDAVTAALQSHGYRSFHQFVVQHGFLEPVKDQARRLGVSRYVLSKLYDAYREFISSTSTGR